MQAIDVTVLYYAGARAAAGVDSEAIALPAQATLGDLVHRLTHRHGDDLGRVLSVCSFLVEEVSAPLHTPLRDGVQVDVLPPFAGG